MWGIKARRNKTDISICDKKWGKSYNLHLVEYNANLYFVA